MRVKTYDIINAGPKNRFMANGRIVSNSGRLIQPQNFPRPTTKFVDEAIDAISDGFTAADVETFFGAPLDILASCLRGLIVPRPGKKFIVYDLSQIEARVVAWLGGQLDILEVFASGEDVYTYTAKKLGLNSRQEGKATVLGLGFGMGPLKFVDLAATYGLTYTIEQSRTIVRDWRESNDNIVQTWWAADATIKRLLESKIGGEEKINDFLTARVGRARNGSKLLTVKLPSSRLLYYRDAELLTETVDGRVKTSIVYAGVDQKTKRWARIRTYGAKIIENATQALARDVVAEMALEIERQGLGDLVLSVHDELIVEVPALQAQERFQRIGKIMNTAPAFVPGLPVAAEGHVLDRYGK